MKRPLIIGLIAIGGIAAGLWWRHTRAAQWNVLLITLDTTRADHLGCYGDAAAVTPHLDSIAAAGVLFERAYTVVPITLPAHATLLTGLLPPEHGLRINGTSRLPDTVPTLAEQLSDSGYRTGAFVSSLVLDSQFGLDRGFETYNDSLSNRITGPRSERPADETVSAAMSWLKNEPSQPFFCWVHLYDAHDPYDPHKDEFGDQFADAPYRGEIAYIDRHIGRMLEWLNQSGVAENTIIIVVGDHGEGLGEHNERTHGYLTYNSTLHVPLMIQHPAQPGGRRVSDPVSLADVFPTVLENLQFEVAQDRHERSLVPFSRGETPSPRPCYAESEAPYIEGGWSPFKTWITPRWKFIHSEDPELYDLVADPHETENVIAAYAEEAALLEQELADFEAALPIRAGVAVASSAEQLKALRGLGYVGGNAPADQADQPMRNIKDVLPYVDQLHQCMHLIDDNEPARAQQILETIVAEVPDYSKAWATLGVCLAVQGNYAEAEKHYRTALDLDAHQNFARIGLGRALYDTGRLESCVEELQTAVAVDPSALDAQFYLGEAYRRLKRWDDARTALIATTKLAPEFSEGFRALADVDQETGDLLEAARGYRQASILDPGSADAAINGARVLTKLEREADAIQMLTQFLQVDPNHVEGLSELALLLATSDHPKLRNPAQAIALAERACELSDRRRHQPLRALAAGQAAVGRFDEAVATATEALAVAKTAQNTPEAVMDMIEAERSTYSNHTATSPDADR